MDRQFSQGKIESIIDRCIYLAACAPKYEPFNAVKEITKRQLVEEYPELKDLTKCPNCNESMREYFYQVSVLDAVLLLVIADNVRLRSHMNPFTVANQVHVPTLHTTDTIHGRTGIAHKLGLIAKVKNKDGKHIPGVWAITARGWQFLRNEPIPAKIRIFRGEILERFEDTITIDQVFRESRNRIESLKGKVAPEEVKGDYRDYESGYDSSEWVHFGELHQGELF